MSPVSRVGLISVIDAKMFRKAASVQQGVSGLLLLIVNDGLFRNLSYQQSSSVHAAAKWR